MNNIKVSIVMPVKNAEKWIRDTVQSILNQSHEQWELIMIDDHSEDNSFDIITSLALIDPRIQFFRNKEYGIISALQLGLQLSKGNYITRMDADDIMPKDRLEVMVQNIECAQIKTIVTGFVEYFPNPVSMGYIKYQNWINARVTNNDHQKHVYRECVIASPNWLARTDEIRRFGNWDKLEYPEDYDMVFKWLEQGFTIKGIEQVTLLWREHPERTSRNSSVYDQRSFFELKLSWFKKLAPFDGQEIALFGSGQKGKIVANYFINNSIDFAWYDHNFDRFKSPVMGMDIGDPMIAKEKVAVLCIDPELENTLRGFLQEKGYVIGKNAWFF